MKDVDDEQTHRRSVAAGHVFHTITGHSVCLAACGFVGRVTSRYYGTRGLPLSFAFGVILRGGGRGKGSFGRSKGGGGVESVGMESVRKRKCGCGLCLRENLFFVIIFFFFLLGKVWKILFHNLSSSSSSLCSFVCTCVSSRSFLITRRIKWSCLRPRMRRPVPPGRGRAGR